MTILAADGRSLDPTLFNRAGAPPGVTNVKNLAEDLNRVVTHVINNDIPPEHKRSHTRLKKILRGTEWGDYASAYDPEQEIIVINVPLKLKKNFLNRNKASADKWYVRLSTSKTSDKGSYWATSPAARTAMQGDNLFEWIIRHEFGHSVDKLIQFTNRFAGHPRFGGWVRYRNNTGLLREILIDLGVDALKGSNALLQDAMFQRFENLLAAGGSNWRPADVIRDLRAKVKSALQEVDPAMRAYWQRAHRLIHYAIDDPWLEGNQVQFTVENGRRYLYNSEYKEWYSCLDSAFQNRISNYQFSSPSEWFAETYAAWRGEGTAFRKLLIPDGPAALNPNRELVDWFDVNLVDSALMFPGGEDLIENKGGPNAALRHAPLPVPDDLEENVPGSWHFKVSAAFGIGNKFNKDAVEFPPMI
jgi:hypothetical protein